MIKLYELSGKNSVIFSPYCWRVRLALLHKQLRFSSLETAFTDITKIHDGTFKTVPVLCDDKININDSFNIIEYLEAAYPTKPSLFKSNEGRALSMFIEAWANSLHPDIARMAIADIYSHLQDKDRTYFRETRESFFGKNLEIVQEESFELAKESFLVKLNLLEKHLIKTEFIGGEFPLYPDYIVFGSLQWLLTTSLHFEVKDLPDNTKIWFSKLCSIYSIKNKEFE